MAKFYVSVDHRLIAGNHIYTTSTTLEAKTHDEAVADVVRYAVRSGHEVMRVSSSVEEEEPKTP